MPSMAMWQFPSARSCTARNRRQNVRVGAAPGSREAGDFGQHIWYAEPKYQLLVRKLAGEVFCEGERAQ
jgi:hypothetical protein